MKHSRVCKVDDKLFRYDYENALVEWVEKPSAEMLEDNKEWQAKHGRDLWDIVDSYVVIDSVGLRLENWKNKESRLEYLGNWADELSEECSWLAHEYLLYG